MTDKEKLANIGLLLDACRCSKDESIKSAFYESARLLANMRDQFIMNNIDTFNKDFKQAMSILGINEDKENE
jgi:hypothetical protein